jgi:hypothetical protein
VRANALQAIPKGKRGPSGPDGNSEHEAYAENDPQGQAHTTFRYQWHVELKTIRRSIVDFGN